MSCVVKCLMSLLYVIHLTVSAQQEKVNNIKLVAPELSPLIYSDGNGQAAGLIIDSLKEVQQHTNLVFEIEILPWARAMKQVVHNQADAIMPALYTLERAQSLVYPKEPLINFEESVVIKRLDDPYVFIGFKFLKSVKNVAKVRAMSLGKELDEASQHGLIKIIDVTKLEDGLNMLLLERVDLVVADKFVANDAVTQMAIKDQILIAPMADQQEPSYIAFSKHFANQHDINKIMSLINQFNKPDSYQRRLQKN